MMNTDATLKAGQIINDKYRVDGVLGSGGMGTVYRAVQLAISRPVAIKLLHHRYLKSRFAIERFRYEANLAGTVASDNICEVIDFGMLNDRYPFIVMPQLRGCTLKELNSRESISFKRALDIGQQTLLALQAVHDAGIVHRDLKPENIFITRVGDRVDFVKLLDFGISQLIAQATPTVSDKPDTISGTPAYMSPEQAYGTANSGPHSDIYSMGVILYELVTGSRPHDGRTFVELAQKILEEPYLPPSKANPNISSELEKIIMRALNKDPRERFESAATFRNALCRARETQSNTLLMDFFPVASEATHTHTATMTMPQAILDEFAEPKENTSRHPPKRPAITRFAMVALPAIGLVAATMGFIAHSSKPTASSTTPSLSSPDTELPAHRTGMSPGVNAVPTLPNAIPEPFPVKTTHEEHPKGTDAPFRFSKPGQSPPQYVRRPPPKSPSPRRKMGKKKIQGRFQTEIISDYID